MAKLDKTRRRRVQDQLPPQKCSARRKTGEPCSQYRVIGASVCVMHGGRAPQVVAAAERRVTLAEALSTGDKRHPWEILEDGLHIVDLVMREVVLDVQERGSVTPQLLDKLISAVERAHRLAKVNLDAGIDQRRVRLAEAQAGQMHHMLTAVLSALHLTQEQKALVPDAVKRYVDGELTQKAIEAA